MIKDYTTPGYTSIALVVGALSLNHAATAFKATAVAFELATADMAMATVVTDTAMVHAQVDLRSCPGALALDLAAAAFELAIITCRCHAHGLCGHDSDLLPP